MSDSTDYESTPSTIDDKSVMEPTIVQKSIGFATLSAMLFIAGILIYLAATSKLSSTPLSLSRQKDQETRSTRLSSTSPQQDFVLSSPMFLDGEELPATHTCKSGNEKGKGIPPPLQWRGVPDGTVELLVTMSDNISGDSKWIVYNIPIGINQLSYENIPKENSLDSKDIPTITDTPISNLRGSQLAEEDNAERMENAGNREETKGEENTVNIIEEEENSDLDALKLDLNADKTIGTIPRAIQTFLPYEEPCAGEKEVKEYSFRIYAFSKHITDADITAAATTATATATSLRGTIIVETERVALTEVAAASAERTITAATATGTATGTTEISDMLKVPQTIPYAPQTATTSTTTTSTIPTAGITTDTTSSTTTGTASSISESNQGRGVFGKVLREGSDPRSSPPAIVKVMEDSLLGEASLRTVFNADVAGNVVCRLGVGSEHRTNRT